MNKRNKTSVSSAMIEKKTAQWRKKWLEEFEFGKNYDVKKREMAATYATKRGKESFNYSLNGYPVEPFCSEIVLEALQSQPILPAKIERLEDITIGIGAGISMQGEFCGAILGHIIGIGIDVAFRKRETAIIRKEISIATRNFCRIFKKKFGAVRCEDLTQTSFLKENGIIDQNALKIFREGDPPKSLKCQNIIRFCVYAPFPSEEI